MSTFFSSLNAQSLVLMRLALMLLAAFGLSRVAKLLKLPNVTDYIISGILIGPYVTGLIPKDMVNGMSFLTDAALALIAFGTGKYFKWETIRSSGSKIIILTVMEALVAAVAVTLAMIFIFHLDVPFSLLLGAIASATAPASTLMTIRQYKAKGEFVDTVLQVVALDDAVSLLAFSVCATLAELLGSQSGFSAADVVLPIVYNVAALVLGALCALLLNLLMRRVKSDYNHLLLVVILLLALSGLCAAFDVSPLLSCMVFGTVHTNISKKPLFDQVDSFSPPILTLFFVVSGMRLNVNALTSAGVIGVGYFLVRIAGKYLGATAGAVMTGRSKPIRRYLGLALIPQAGVAIGLAALGERILSGDLGSLLSTIILSSSVLYEMVGPAAAKLSMHLAGAIPSGAKPDRSEDEAAENREYSVPSEAYFSAKRATAAPACAPEMPLPGVTRNDDEPELLDPEGLGVNRLFSSRRRLDTDADPDENAARFSG